jgi:hypothetical protein
MKRRKGGWKDGTQEGRKDVKDGTTEGRKDAKH